METTRYEMKPFKVDGHICHWQLMWRCGDGTFKEGYVCHRFVEDAFRMSGNERRKLERNLSVPLPRLSAKERAAFEEVAVAFSVDNDTKRAVLRLLQRDRWKKAGHTMVERLAKADIEAYEAAKLKGGASEDRGS